MHMKTKRGGLRPASFPLAFRRFIDNQIRHLAVQDTAPAEPVDLGVADFRPVRKLCFADPFFLNQFLQIHIYFPIFVHLTDNSLLLTLLYICFRRNISSIIYTERYFCKDIAMRSGQVV